MANQVVAHLANGTVLKGTTVDFYPNRTSFHVVPATGGAAVEVLSAQMKASSSSSLEVEQNLAARFSFQGGHTQCRRSPCASRGGGGEVLCVYSCLRARRGVLHEPRRHLCEHREFHRAACSRRSPGWARMRIPWQGGLSQPVAISVKP